MLIANGLAAAALAGVLSGRWTMCVGPCQRQFRTFRLARFRLSVTSVFTGLHSAWRGAYPNPRQAELSAAYRSDLIAEAVGTVREHGAGTGELGRLLARAVVAALFDGLVRQRLLNPAQVPDDLFGSP
jgi:hypothetical protein